LKGFFNEPGFPFAVWRILFAMHFDCASGLGGWANNG